MQHRIITSVAVLMGALILAIIAGVVPVFPFSTEETAYAQTTRPDDATLQLLTVAPAQIALVAGTTEYTTRVDNSMSTVIVSPTTNNPNATYRISPSDADGSTADDHDVALQPGQNTRITITVTAEDRRARETYTVTIYRERSTQSPDQTLSALSLAGVSLSPRFSSGTTEYDARVPYNVTEVTVEATAADIGAEAVLVTSSDGTANPSTVNTATTATNVVTLATARGTDTDITVTVTAENGTADVTKAYEITIYRESGPVLSDVATLSALTVTSAPITGFEAGTNEYTTRLATDADVESVTVSWTLSNGAPGATVDIMPADQDSSTEGNQVYLTPGANTVITVTVTAEDRSTNTYTVTVYQVHRVNTVRQ